MANKNTKKKAPTKPWSTKGPLMVGNEILKDRKERGVRQKWVDAKKEGNVERMLEDGWVIVKREVKTEKTVEDGSAVDTTVKKRGMILMEIPEERAKERDKYYANKSNNVSTQTASKDLEGVAYGSVKVSH